MPETVRQVYGYRWVVLAVFFLLTAVIEIQWLTFAAIAREARLYYDVSPLAIDFLSLIFMLVFLIVCLPASWVVDTKGIRAGLGTGAGLTGIFSLMKGFFPDDYFMVAVAQTGLAVAQPFILNAATRVAVQWFPLKERAIAVGIATLAQFVGIIIVMIATPLMIVPLEGGQVDLAPMLMSYGIISAAAALILILFLKERPPRPPEPDEPVQRLSQSQSFSHILSQPDMRYVFPMFFIGLGVFNAVSTCIDQICQAKGLTVEQTGLIGGIMLVAGIIGAIVLPQFSDRMQRRRAFIILAMAGTLPGLAGLVFFTGYMPVLASAFVMGFFLLGAGAPVGFQYCAEITCPAPESLSQGLLLLAGQVSGILFILIFNLAGGAYTLPLFLGLFAVNVLLSLKIKESPQVLAERNKKRGNASIR